MKTFIGNNIYLKFNNLNISFIQRLKIQHDTYRNSEFQIIELDFLVQVKY